MANKIYKLIIILLVIIIICMGVYIYGCQKDLALQDYFDMNGDYSSEWDNTSNEITVEKVIPLKFNQTYENIVTDVVFFKDSAELGNVSVTNNTYDGKLVIHTKAKLSEEPDNIQFNIVDGELIDSDAEGLNYSRNFHLF